HAATPADAGAAATEAGVDLRELQPAAPGLIRAEIAGNRDDAMDRLRTANNVVHHVYRQAAEPANEYLITETFFIRFKPDTPEDRIRSYFAAENLVVEQRVDEWTYLVRVTNATGRNPLRAANAARTREDVEFAEPNLVRKLTRFAFIPPDALFASQWHLHAPAAVAPDLASGAGIFAPDAWDITRGRRDVVVAVADDGFDLTHPDFQGPGKVVASLNATPRLDGSIDWDADVHPRPGSPGVAGDYHGTPCLGVAVAEGNGVGTVGVAPGCSLVAVRFPLSMDDANFITMFRKVSTLADVMSCSWGYPPGDYGMNSALHSAIADVAKNGGRRGKGLVICVAAGNNNAPVQDLANTRTYRYLGQFGIQSVTGPIDRWIAAHPDVITVSATTSRKTRSAYSSWGTSISVCAPSDNWDDLGQITPPGLGVTTTDNEGFGLNTDFTSGSRFTSAFGGTSSATPTTAGVCALMISANSALTAKEVKDLLQATADKDLSLITDTPVNEPGDFNANGVSLWFGHGKINAARAVQRAAAVPAQERTVDQAVQAGLDIPDVGAVVTSALDIADQGRINEIRIQVDIRHTYIGDLRVDLVAPDGTAVALHSNSGGSARDLVRTFAVADTPALQPLTGRPVAGRWELRVRDSFRLDVGRINSWRFVARVRD
ncbi:MAG TPA: S8 family serine peptidase, partial [Thermoanaerobaculia bacterium]|nr:S8 family serine peptidase [Thermoanaerobaculia bacterium]